MPATLSARRCSISASGRIVILSVTQEPLKYLHIPARRHHAAEQDRPAAHQVDFDVARAMANARAVNPDIATQCVSARTGEWLDAWYDWLRGQFSEAKQAGPV
jgi:hydrogenase nickel incorporation protein HypB